MQNHLESGQGIVSQRPVVQDSITFFEWRDVDIVVQHDGARGLHVALHPRGFQENHLGVVVGVGAHLKFTTLEKVKLS